MSAHRILGPGGAKTPGKDLARRASDFRFRSAFSACQLGMRLRPRTCIVAPRGKTFVHRSFDLTLFVKSLIYGQSWSGEVETYG
jgi:hypothetical protein